MSLRTMLPRVALVAGGLTVLLAAPAAAATGSSKSASAGSTSATFNCTSVDVTATGPELSNVVLRFASGDQKFEPLRGHEATFSGTGAFAGAPIETAFVKAGNNGSDEGPGYGTRFDAPADSCAATPASTSAPTPENTGGNTSTGGNTGNTGGESAGTAQVTVGFACDNTTVDVTSTKDLSNVVLRLSDGRDVKVEGLHDRSQTFTAPAGTSIVAVFVKSGNNASGEGPGYGKRFDAPAEHCAPTPATVGGSPATGSPAPGQTAGAPGGQAPSSPAPAAGDQAAAALAPAASAASGEKAAVAAPAIPSLTNAVAAGVATGRPAEVLGISMTRQEASGAALARTGLDLRLMVLTAGLMLSAGVVLLRRAGLSRQAR